jgi:hypothetical protein
MIPMTQKVQQATKAALQNSADELLEAHQILIDTWYKTWANEQRERAAELLRKRHQSINLPAAAHRLSSKGI